MSIQRAALDRHCRQPLQNHISQKREDVSGGGRPAEEAVGMEPPVAPLTEAELLPVRAVDAVPETGTGADPEVVLKKEGSEKRMD